MASDGILNKAKAGTCRICLRVRNTEKYLKIVGEVRHGFALGYIWECVDIEECEKKAIEKLNRVLRADQKQKIKTALKIGRFNHYVIHS